MAVKGYITSVGLIPKTNAQQKIALIPGWEENSFLSSLYERGAFLSIDQMTTVEELSEIIPMLGTSEDLRAKIALGLWRHCLHEFSPEAQKMFLYRLGRTTVIENRFFKLGELNYGYVLHCLFWNNTIDINTAKNNTAPYFNEENFSLRFKKAFLELVRLSGFEDPEKEYSRYIENKEVRSLDQYHVNWYPTKHNYWFKHARTNQKIEWKDGVFVDENGKRIRRITAEGLEFDEPARYNNRDELIQLFHEQIKQRTFELHSEEILKTMNKETNMPQSKSSFTATVTEDEESRLKTAAKNIGRSLLEGAKEGGKLAAADQLSMLFADFLKGVLVSAGVSEELLDSEWGQTLVAVVSPMIVMVIAEVFDELPQIDVLKEGAQKAMTAVTYREIKKRTQILLPKIQELIVQSSQVQKARAALPEAQELDVEKATKKPRRKKVPTS